MRIPPTASYGTYRIRWTLKELVNSPPQTVVQEFEIVSNDSSLVVTMNPAERDMVDKLRLLLRDQNPDKYYHFRPPEHESSIGAYNRVFGQVWEDAEFS